MIEVEPALIGCSYGIPVSSMRTSKTLLMKGIA
jgi:hypothetical protein